MITQAIELNEQLEKVLTHHDSLLSVQATTPPTSCIDQEAEDEEDAERLYRRFCCLYLFLAYIENSNFQLFHIMGKGSVGTQVAASSVARPILCAILDHLPHTGA